jgi:molecular chaperone DnaK
MTKLIERNTTIPTSKKEVFSTAADSQPTVDIHILQGEREFAKDNRTLGRFQLTGIPPAPRGVPQIEVAFNIDSDGIIHVSAKDTATGQEQSIEIKGSSGLDSAEVERMTKDAEQHAEDDKKRREVIDLKNQADQLIYQTENTLKEHGDKIPAEERSSVESAINGLREAVKLDDGEAIKKAMEAVATSSQTIGKIMYEEAAKTQAASAGAAPEGEAPADQSGKKDDDDVIDAEYEVKD